MLIDNAGTPNVTATYRYDPYGNSITATGTNAANNVYRFSSKEFHVKSGMYYYGYRWYDPNLQRWPNRDPIEESGGINLYGFVENNPLTGVDLWGLEGKNLPPGFRYYSPGSDWVPGSELVDCRLAAELRYLNRERRGLTHELQNACIPALDSVTEGKHVVDFIFYGDRAAESNLVKQLDEWACYMKWDPLLMPPHLKKLLDDLSRKYEKAHPKNKEHK